MSLITIAADREGLAFHVRPGTRPRYIAHVKNRIAIVDFKTSKDATVYPEAKVALRAHAKLWNEHRP
jgi:hypothetical protein